ncbi:MAG: hypothetical protein KDK25_12915, partial [Leptospiraceae bacterium]|nr:hypothetical protein [Leptospiraceae bacterium]
LALDEEAAKSEGIPVERLQKAAQNSLLSEAIRNPAHPGAHRFHMEVLYGGRPQILDPVCMPFQIYTGHGLSNRLLIVSLVTEEGPQAAEPGTEGSIEGCSERMRFEYLSYIPAFGLGNLEEDLDTLMKSFIRHCIEKLPRRKEAPVSDPHRMNPVHP